MRDSGRHQSPLYSDRGLCRGKPLFYDLIFVEIVLLNTGGVSFREVMYANGVALFMSNILLLYFYSYIMRPKASLSREKQRLFGYTLVSPKKGFSFHLVYVDRYKLWVYII